MRSRYSVIIPTDTLVLALVVMMTLGLCIGAILCRVMH